ncbi:hypothetical protein AC068_17425 [Morganella morganii]|nr:hypothetical protein AC068_17425 [Morganella morganii]PCO28251.1 hypothetical protein CP987_06585 [Morganella morganii]
MRYSKIKTYYLIKSGHGHHDNMVRYDIITISKDEYLISVLYGKHGEPSRVIEFNFTREEYEKQHGCNGCMIHFNDPVSFEDALDMKCQEHRDSLE